MSKVSGVGSENYPAKVRRDIGDKQAGYSPIFGLGDGKKDPTPRWLPISLVRPTNSSQSIPE